MLHTSNRFAPLRDNIDEIPRLIPKIHDPEERIRQELRKEEVNKRNNLKRLNQSLIDIHKNVIESGEWESLFKQTLNDVDTEGWSIYKNKVVKNKDEILSLLKNLLEIAKIEKIWIANEDLDERVEKPFIKKLSSVLIPYILILGSFEENDKKALRGLYSDIESSFIKKRLEDWKNEPESVEIYINFQTMISWLHVLKYPTVAFSCMKDIKEISSKLVRPAGSLIPTIWFFATVQQDRSWSKIIFFDIPALLSVAYDTIKTWKKWQQIRAPRKEYNDSKKRWEFFHQIYKQKNIINSLNSSFKITKKDRNSVLGIEKAYHIFRKLVLDFDSSDEQNKNECIGRIEFQTGEIQNFPSFGALLLQNEGSLNFFQGTHSCCRCFGKKIKKDYGLASINYLIIEKIFKIISNKNEKNSTKSLCVDLIVCRSFSEINPKIQSLIKDKSSYIDKEKLLNTLDRLKEFGILLEEEETDLGRFPNNGETIKYFYSLVKGIGV